MDLDKKYPDSSVVYPLFQEIEVFHPDDIAGVCVPGRDVGEIYRKQMERRPRDPIANMRVCLYSLARAWFQTFDEVAAVALRRMPREPHTFISFHLPLARAALDPWACGDRADALLDDVPEEIRAKLAGYKALRRLQIQWRSTSWQDLESAEPLPLLDPRRYIRKSE